MDNKVACKYCGEMIDPDAGYCPVCGAVNQDLIGHDPNKEYCKFCGSELSGNETFCLVCGTPVRRVLAGNGTKRSSIDDIVPDLKKKEGTEIPKPENEDLQAASDDERGDGKEEEPLNFLEKAARKQQQYARREEELEQRRIEETRAFNEEKEKLRVSATQAYGDARQTTQTYGAGRQTTQIYGAGRQATQTYGANVSPDKAVSQTTKSYESASSQQEDADYERLKSQAEEAGVSVEEMRLFEQVKANFETENETYPDDYNVNDYAQFDYAQSRYGAFNIGSLELESMQYQNQEAKTETPEPVAAEPPRKEKIEQGVIGVKQKKTPLGTRILVFFAAIVAVAGLAGIILYIVPMVKQVHPEDILLEESVDTGELTITPISAATSTPTPTVSPTPTTAPTPTVNAIIPQSVTPSAEPVNTQVSETDEDVEAWNEEDELEGTVPEAISSEPPESGFLVPDSDTRVMDPSELDGLSSDEIRLIANEIYARYGYAFRSEEIADYFGQFDWYDPIYDPEDFPDDIMSEAAQANLNMIAEYEAEHGD